MITSGSPFGGSVITPDVSFIPSGTPQNPIYAIPGLRAWWDSSDADKQHQSVGGAASGIGDPVGQWLDRVAGIPFLETDSARPTIAMVDGRRVVLFNGVNQQMFAPALIGTEFLAAGFFAVVFTPLSVIPYGTPIGFQDGGPGISREGTNEKYGVSRPGISGPVSTLVVTPGARLILTGTWESNTSGTIYKFGGDPRSLHFDQPGIFSSNSQFALARHNQSGYSFEHYYAEGVLLGDEPILESHVTIIEQEYNL